jgi:hypothetical protein
MSKRTSATKKTPLYVDFKDFNIDLVVIQPTKKQYPGGGNFFTIMYAHSEEDKVKGNLYPLQILTPSNLNHWGMKDFENNGNWNLSVPIVDSVPHKFVEIFQELDAKVKAFAFENSEQFFGSKKSKEVADAFFVETLKPYKDKVTGAVKKYIVNFKIPYNKGQFKILLCNERKQPIFPNATTSGRVGTEDEDTPNNYLQKNSTIKFVFSINAIYLSNSRYGYSKKFTQGIVSSPEPTMLDTCLIDDSDKEDAEEDDEDDDEFGVPGFNAQDEDDEEVKPAAV